MKLESDWQQIREVFIRARRSGLHHAFATVSPDGRPHVTPIGSLWLHPEKPRGIYFDVFNKNLCSNLNKNQRVSVLAVDAHRALWLWALLRGRFSRLPGVRLHGVAGVRRRASAKEEERIRRMFRRVRLTRGHDLLWRRIEWVRDIQFDDIDPVRIGRMTQGL